MAAGRTRSRHAWTRTSSLLGAALIVAVAVLAHVAALAAGASPTNAAVAASGTSKPEPTANLFVGSNDQPFARCMSTNPNTAYCPHNAGNSEQPEAGKAYNTTNMLRMTWNSKWPSLATEGAVDLYLCPTDGTKCIPMATAVSVSVEIVDASIDPAKVKPGRYTYVVVPLNNKPEDTSFSERGVELVIQAGPTTSTTFSVLSTASPTATSSIALSVSTGPIPTSGPDSSTKSATQPASTAVTGVVGGLIVIVVVVVAAFVFARKQQQQRSPIPPNVLKPTPPTAIVLTAMSTITAAPMMPTVGLQGGAATPATLVEVHATAQADRQSDEFMYLPSASVADSDQGSLYLPPASADAGSHRGSAVLAQ
ncbi:hypothetical protein GGF32_005558 [Allomyces javanicus]|nr:hypothetical protein GGF32_005558 [Allomyces javanicus]